MLYTRKPLKMEESKAEIRKVHAQSWRETSVIWSNPFPSHREAREARTDSGLCKPPSYKGAVSKSNVSSPKPRCF